VSFLPTLNDEFWDWTSQRQSYTRNRVTWHHHFTPVLKPLHWLKIPERIHFKVLSVTYNSLQSSQPTYLRELFTIQPTRSILDHHPVSPFLDPWSLLISCSPTEPYPSLHNVFGMTYHLNCAPFLRLHRRHCQSQDIVFIWLLYPSPRLFHSKLKCHLFKHSCPDQFDHSPTPSERRPP